MSRKIDRLSVSAGGERDLNTGKATEHTALEELWDYLAELGYLNINDVSEAITVEEARAFIDSLSPTQRQRLQELQEAI